MKYHIHILGKYHTKFQNTRPQKSRTRSAQSTTSKAFQKSHFYPHSFSDGPHAAKRQRVLKAHKKDTPKGALLNHTLALSALDLGLAAHTIVLVVCLPVIAECRIEVRIGVAVCHRREVCRCLPSLQHPECREMHPELIRRFETSGQQIRIPSAVVCRIEYRRQIDALIDPIRDGLWPEPCIDLRCDGTIDQQIVDVRPRAERGRE